MIDIDGDETFLSWLGEKFDGEVLRGDPQVWGVEPIAIVEDATDGRFSRDMPFFKTKEGLIGWFEPDSDEVNLCKEDLGYSLENLLKDLADHEARQVPEDETILWEPGEDDDEEDT